MLVLSLLSGFSSDFEISFAIDISSPLTTKSNPWRFLSPSFNTIFDTRCIVVCSCSCDHHHFHDRRLTPVHLLSPHWESDQRSSLVYCLPTSVTSPPFFCRLSFFLVEALMDFYLDRNTVTVVVSPIPVDILTPRYPPDTRLHSSWSLFSS